MNDLTKVIYKPGGYFMAPEGDTPADGFTSAATVDTLNRIIDNNKAAQDAGKAPAGRRETAAGTKGV